MKNTNPGENLEAEGLPELEERPPGIDVELEQEGMMAPRDHPIAVGDDPAYPTTAAEDRAVEGVAERAARENPDFGAEELGVGGSVQASHPVTTDDTVGETSLPADPDAARTAEEAAVHVRSDADDI